MITLFQYPGCSTCKKALKWLDARGTAYESVHIVESPPSKTRLVKLIKRSGLPTKKFFNTSGKAYREGGWSKKVSELSVTEAAAELAKNGMLIKRPLVDGGEDGPVLVGFNEDVWAETLLG